MTAASTDFPTTAAPRRRRWWLIGTVAVLLVAATAYAVSPVIAAGGLLQAARRGDVAAIEARVDFPRLRRSLARQIVAEALRVRQVGGLERQLAMGAGTTALSAWLDDLLTARTMADLLGGREIAQAPPEALIDLSMIRAVPLRSLVSIWWASRFGSPTRYELALPRGGGDPARIVMELRGGAWRVSGLTLPDDLKEVLARRLAASTAPKPAQP